MFFEKGFGLRRTTAALGPASRHETELPERSGTIVHRCLNGSFGDSVTKANVHTGNPEIPAAMTDKA